MIIITTSLVPRPSTPPVFDRLQYAASDQKLEVWKAWEQANNHLVSFPDPQRGSGNETNSHTNDSRNSDKLVSCWGVLN